MFNILGRKDENKNLSYQNVPSKILSFNLRHCDSQGDTSGIFVEAFHFTIIHVTFC
jgi:hypothetical protein